ncbi:hypothetical protein CJ199_15230, partial [Brevibacterium paucivorans]
MCAVRTALAYSVSSTMMKAALMAAMWTGCVCTEAKYTGKVLGRDILKAGADRRHESRNRRRARYEARDERIGHADEEHCKARREELHENRESGFGHLADHARQPSHKQGDADDRNDR